MKVQLMKKLILWSLQQLLFCWYCVYGVIDESATECPKYGWTCHHQSGKWKAISKLPGTEGVLVTFDQYPQALISIYCSGFKGKKLHFPRSFLKNFTWEGVTDYRFVQCPSPKDITFAEILEGHTVKALRWTADSSIGDSMDVQNFKGLNGLQSLNLAECGITTLPNTFFSLFPILSTLRLNSNNISHLPHTTFAALTELRFLELGNNNIKQLNEKFDGLKNLQKLYLYHNQIEAITRSFFASIPLLEIADLQDNNLTNLPSDLLQDVPLLKTLRLFKNNLKHIPTKFLQFQIQLNELDISDNPLTSLPQTLIHNLTTLSKLNLNRCQFQTLPTNFFQSKQLATLSILQLDHNDLIELQPGMFGDLNNLITLDISYNNITVLPTGALKALWKLNSLQLKKNKLITIEPLAFLDLHELKILDLSSNNLTIIPKEALMPTGKLEELHLSGNKLSYPEFTRNPFKIANSLQIINLSKNKIKGLPIAWLQENTNLKKLDLSSNELEYFNADECEPASDLIIDLTNNKISKAVINVNLADRLAELNGVVAIRDSTPSIILGNNPFICDCNAKDLLYYYWHQSRRRYSFTIDLDNLQCSSPTSLAGREVATVTMAEMICELQGDCPTLCRCLKHALGNVIEVNCSFKNLTELPLQAPFNTSMLHFEHNLLVNLSGFEKSHWTNLTHVYLNDNKIREIDANMLPKKIIQLDLQGNLLSNLSEANLKLLQDRPLMEVLFQDNPWACNCQAKDFKLWLNENIQRVGNVSNVLCNATSRPVYMEDVCPLPSINTRAILVGATVISLVLAMGLATAGIGYYRYRHEIKVWLYSHRWCMWFVTEHEIDRDKTYDAFVSFSQEDADFVASHLLPGLESGEPTYKICIHHRDWLAGEWIPDQIVRSVQDSRRTIVILSKNFIRSVWGRLEFKAAHHQALQDRMNRIIIIVFGDVPPSSEMDPELKMYVKFNTYLKWGDPWFWQKLRYAMPHSPICMPPIRSSSTMAHFSSSITDQPRIPMSRISTSVTNNISEDKLELVYT